MAGVEEERRRATNVSGSKGEETKEVTPTGTAVWWTAEGLVKLF
jgi:hypothetical protein